MSIASIVAAALKRVPWTSLAMNYGPDLLKKFKGGAPAENEEEAARFLEEIEKRMKELEALVTEQDTLIKAQQERIESLTASCAQLEGRVKLFRAIGIAATLIAVGAVIALALR